MSIPWFEDNWETDPETGETAWAPFMLAAPPAPGFPGPDRWGEWLGVLNGGKQIGPAPVYGWVRPEDREAAERVREPE